ncbi:MAG: hypothetical protein KF858_08845 [Candidatus Sumerlaeia bacterium]|nr:hypothetical protein [Candidatus Sumerlaeia bacterium]
MRCPYCETENRDDRERCYHCSKDLTMLRLIRNKAKHHYNVALEHAERGRPYEAMGELKNALELDSRLNEARLLLGTLFARLERPEEAREQWRRVVESNETIHRAHAYICALPELERALPLVRRTRRVVFAGVAAVFLGALTTTMVLWPSREDRFLRAAWAEFARPNPAASLDLLAELPRPLSTEQREVSAQLLETSIDRLLRERMEAINRLVVDRSYGAAHEELGRLQAMHLPAAYDKALEQTRTLLVQAAVRDLEEAAAAPFGAEAREQVTRRAAMLRTIAPDSSLPDNAVAAFAAKGRRELDELVAAVEAALEQGGDLIAVEGKLERARALARVVEDHEAVEPLIAALNERRVAILLDAIERAHAEQDLPGAQELLAAVPSLDLSAAAQARLRRLETAVAESLRHQERQRVLAVRDAVEQALDNEEIEAALDLAETIEWDALGAGEAEGLRARLDEAARRMALQGYYSLMAAADRFDSATISEEEARRALRRIRRIEGQLPAALAVRAQDDLLFFEAVALHVLGRTDEAQQRIAALRERLPRSPYLVTWDALHDAHDATPSS